MYACYSSWKWGGAEVTQSTHNLQPNPSFVKFNSVGRSFFSTTNFIRAAGGGATITTQISL